MLSQISSVMWETSITGRYNAVNRLLMSIQYSNRLCSVCTGQDLSLERESGRINNNLQDVRTHIILCMMEWFESMTED
jgi:hypothetical protein